MPQLHVKIFLPTLLIACLLLAVSAGLGTLSDQAAAVQAADKTLLAGAYAIDITPPADMLPISVNGGITEARVDRVVDALHSRSLVLDDGSGKIAITVVDSCLIERELLDHAKQLAHERTGIPIERMLISTTHTHSAPAVTGVHGSTPDERYRAYLPGKIAEGIQRASERLNPARVGWGVSHNPDYVFCRRWYMKPGTANTAPFTGHTENRAQMNPGNNNPNRIGPTGPVDTAVTVLSIQTKDGKPLAVLANYSTHYAGAPALSADYFAVFGRRIGELIGARPGQDPEFVGIMSNGTSGDANCSNFSLTSPSPRDRFTVADAIARTAYEAYRTIKYYDWAPVVMAEQLLKVDVRMPGPKEVEEAKAYLAKNLKNGRVSNMAENYARETVLLSELPPFRELRLQAIRVGDFGITTSPGEMYGITGLKIKADSPFQTTMNICLANGFVGYVPPPEQHVLGGYTTWRARSSCLEVQAEPKIRRTLQDLLVRVAQKEGTPVASE